MNSPNCLHLFDPIGSASYRVRYDAVSDAEISRVLGLIYVACCVVFAASCRTRGVNASC